MTFFEPSNLYNNDLVNQVPLNLQQWIVVNRKLHNVKVFFNNVEQHSVYFNSCCNQINELLLHCKAVRAKRTMFVLAKTILRPTCAETAHTTSIIHDVHAKSDSHMKDSFFIWHWSKTLFAWTSTPFITPGQHNQRQRLGTRATVPLWEWEGATTTSRWWWWTTGCKWRHTSTGTGHVGEHHPCARTSVSQRASTYACYWSTVHLRIEIALANAW